MRKSLLIGLLLLGGISANAQYQLPNGNFEGGTRTSGSNVIPESWGWFDNATGGLEGTAADNSYVQVVEDGNNHYVKVIQGVYEIKIGSMVLSSIPVNGNLTTGIINASSAVANDPKGNYNYSDPTNNIGQSFQGKPDAVSFKYSVKKANNRQAQLKIVIHGDGRYQDPEGENDYSSILWGKVVFPTSSTEGDGLLPKTVPFEFGSQMSTIEPKGVLVSLSTDAEAGKGSKDDYIALDDLKFIYYNELGTLTYNGQSIDFDANQSVIDLSKYIYEEGKLEYTPKGVGATVEASLYDKEKAQIVLTVKGNDWTEANKNEKVYTLQFAKPNVSDVANTYNRWVTVTLSTEEGSGVASESLNAIVISGDENGKAVFSLTGFTFPGMGDMGTVVIKDGLLSYDVDGSILIEAPNQNVYIEKLKMNVPVEFAGRLKDSKLTADVHIDLTQMLGMNVSVQVGDIPFTTSEENGILKVTGTVSKLGAASVKGESTANEIDLIGATLAEDLKTSDFSVEANNTLYKIADVQTLDGNNVIQNGTCKTLVLTDGLTFNAPEGFEATNVTFNRKFTTGNLSTVVLPFSFDAADVNGTVYKLESVENGVLSFKSVEGKADANVPYLVKTEGDNLFKTETPKNVTVAQTPETVENSIAGTGVTHVGNFGETMNITSNDQTSWYGYNKNGSFVKVLSGTVKPFRSAIKSTGAAPSSFALKLDGTVTGILNLENPNAKVDVYTVSGVCVRKNVPAASALNGLSRGVYIVGGQKVVK